MNHVSSLCYNKQSSLDINLHLQIARPSVLVKSRVVLVVSGIALFLKSIDLYHRQLRYKAISKTISMSRYC